MRKSVGGWQRRHGTKEHVACPGLSHLEGFVATRTLVDEPVTRGAKPDEASGTIGVFCMFFSRGSAWRLPAEL